MSELGSTEDYRTAQAALMRAKEEHLRAKTADLRVETLLKKAKTADFQVRVREREAHIEVLEARAEKLRLQSRDFENPSDRETRLQEKIDRLRSETQKLEERYSLADLDEGGDHQEELERLAGVTFGKPLVRRPRS